MWRLTLARLLSQQRADPEVGAEVFVAEAAVEVDPAFVLVLDLTVVVFRPRMP